jgi:hypothetical protein
LKVESERKILRRCGDRSRHKATGVSDDLRVTLITNMASVFERARRSLGGFIWFSGHWEANGRVTERSRFDGRYLIPTGFGSSVFGSASLHLLSYIEEEIS